MLRCPGFLVGAGAPVALWAEGKHRSAMVVIDDEAAIAAFHITCGSSHCAFWTGNEARVVRHDQIKRLNVKPAMEKREAK